MSQSKFNAQWILTNLLLTAVVVLLAVICVSLNKEQPDNRYEFQIFAQTREIYIFDKRTGKLFITSPEVIGNFAEEVWTELSPVQKGKSLSFKQFLRKSSDIRLSKKLLEESKRLQEGQAPPAQEPQVKDTPENKSKK